MWDRSCSAGSVSASAYVAMDTYPPAATSRSGRNHSGQDGARRVCTCRPTRRGIADLRAELLSFPAGKHDDQVDALGLVGQLLDKMVDGAEGRLSEPICATDTSSREHEGRHGRPSKMASEDFPTRDKRPTTTQARRCRSWCACSRNPRN